jgi:peptide deformylase
VSQTVEQIKVVIPPDVAEWYGQRNPGVVHYPSEGLRRHSSPVRRVTASTMALVSKMLKMVDMHDGLGLAAPQIGVLSRVIVIAPIGEKAMAVINPEITFAEGAAVGQEGCLSLPGLYGDVERALDVEVRGSDVRGKPLILKLSGLPARVAQHEIDHLDGVLFIDKADPATLHWQYPEDDETE